MTSNITYTDTGINTNNIVHNGGSTPTAVIIKSGGSSATWATTSTIDSGQAVLSVDNYTMNVKGNAEFSGDLTVKGISILETLESINKRLVILTPNIELEQRWEKLKELRQQYIDLEKDILEKEQIINILKR